MYFGFVFFLCLNSTFNDLAVLRIKPEWDILIVRDPDYQRSEWAGSLDPDGCARTARRLAESLSRESGVANSSCSEGVVVQLQLRCPIRLYVGISEMIKNTIKIRNKYGANYACIIFVFIVYFFCIYFVI